MAEAMSRAPTSLDNDQVGLNGSMRALEATTWARMAATWRGDEDALAAREPTGRGRDAPPHGVGRSRAGGRGEPPVWSWGRVRLAPQAVCYPVVPNTFTKRVGRKITIDVINL
jgi:hypothetical protein